MPYSVLYCVIYLFILSLKAISLIGGKYLLKHKLKIERLYWPLDFCLVGRHLHSLPILCPLANMRHLSCGDVLSFDATQIVILFECQIVQIVHLQQDIRVQLAVIIDSRSDRFACATIVYCRFVFVRQFRSTVQRPNNRHQHPCPIENKHLARPSKFTPSHLRCDLIVQTIIRVGVFSAFGWQLLACPNQLRKVCTYCNLFIIAIIVYHCLSNIWALFEPQIRKVLIINNFNILHRQVNLHTNDKR